MADVILKGTPTTVYIGRPRFEGSNICTWIGFKHVMYLVEEAVLDHFRQSGLVPRFLYEEHGLCLEIVDSSVRILHALHMDDEVRVEVTPLTRDGDSEVTLSLQLLVERGEEQIKALTGKVKVLFRRDTDGAVAGAAPEVLTPYVCNEIRRPASKPVAGPGFYIGRGTENPDNDVLRMLVPEGSNAFVWSWHIPYFYCHFTQRIQHSGYLRLMEEVVDLFLADRGISIRTMLDTRRWIPVVPEARVEILQEALMEETIYTVYTVEEIYKGVTYAARMDCYVIRNGAPVHTATGRIVHGYAEILNRRDWALVNFDAETLAALRGEGR